MNDKERERINEAMIRLADGDRGAFDVVFDGLWPHVLAFVSRAMPGHPDREDVAQRTLLNVFARISDFDTRRDGVSWVFGIAAFEVKTLRRQLQRRRETSADDSLEGIQETAISSEDLVIRADLRAALADVLTHLSDPDRDALLGRGDAGTAGGVTRVALRKRAPARARTVARLVEQATCVTFRHSSEMHAARTSAAVFWLPRAWPSSSFRSRRSARSKRVRSSARA